jgi:hypothetical protein
LNICHKHIKKRCTQTILDSIYNIKVWAIINSGCVEITCNATDDSDIEATYISEITTAFIIANASIRLYAMLSWLHPSQNCFCDTDSVMIMFGATSPIHTYPSNDATDLPSSVKVGKGLSEWDNKCQKGEWIMEFVIGGVKSDSYRTTTGKHCYHT